jgi:quaternary ammonium compound-resistance protein SugE
MPWLFLVLASVFEVGFTTSMRLSNGFKQLLAVIGFLVCVSLSLLFLELANRSIPLGTAYAIWTGVGATGTVVIGMIWFGEPVSIVRLLLIAGVVGCAIGLKVTSSA